MASAIFLDSLKTNERKKFSPFMKDFELCCILSDIEEAVLLIPFDTKEYTDQLKVIHSYIRQKVISNLGQKLLVNAVFNSDKGSQDSINLLLKKISGEDSSPLGGFGDMLKAALDS